MESIKHKAHQRIKVVVRKRPINQKENEKNDFDIIEKMTETHIAVKEPKTKFDLTKYIEEHNFYFDQVFDESTTNEDIYNSCVKPLVKASFNGTKVTCFAYGQTGSGKTFTMMGPPNSNNYEIPGLFLLSAQEIFETIKTRKEKINITVSFYEIYCGKLFDLLNGRNTLFLREDGKQNINIVGLSEKYIESVQDLMSVISFGLSVRTTGITGANVDSSRSHAILQICLRAKNNQIFGKISFIDLAGSERGADTIDQDRQTRMDGSEINKSLLALKECIRALDQDQKHLPFRGSKLTLVLKDSFIGNCMTLMIANISPTFSCCEHTLNTLRYADRVKELSNPNQADVHSTGFDKLSQALLLPRQNTNVNRILFNGKEQQTFQAPKMNGNIMFNPSPEKLSPERQKSLIITKNAKRNFQDKDIPAMNSQENNEQGSKYSAKPNKSLGPEEIAKLNQDHEKLIDVILEEEDELIDSHKSHIDLIMDLAKQEMSLLQEVNKPGSDIKEYVSNLDAILNHKLEMIQILKDRIKGFCGHLSQEEAFSKKCQSLQG